MFYSHEVLTSRKYGVATVWLVATLGSKSTLKKVSRKAILDVDVAKACETIVTPDAPMALRLQSNLLYGVTRVYAQQCGYVLNDAESAKQSMRMMFKVMRKSALDAEGGNTGRAEQLMLQDDPNFLPDLDLMPMDLDRIDIDAMVADGSQRSTLSPHSSQSARVGAGSQQDMGDLVIPPSASSLTGDPVGGFGAFSVRGDSAAGSGGGAGRFLDDDLGLEIDFDGNLTVSDRAARQPRAPSDRVDRPDQGSVMSGARGGNEEFPPGGDIPDDNGFLPMEDDYMMEPEADLAMPPAAGRDQQQETSEETAAAPLRRPAQTKLRVIPLDHTMELRNGDIARWSTNYLANMNDALHHKNVSSAAARAKKNAEYWMLGGDDDGPLGIFSGAKLLDTLARINAPQAGTKRGREDGDEVDGERRVRSRSGPSSDEIGRGFEDEGYMPVMGDDAIEQGREAATPLDDRHLSSMMPWNQSTGSRRPTGLFSGAAHGHSTSLGGGSGAIGRRGSRLTSASPLVGRGAGGGDIDDFQLAGSQGDIGMTGLDEFELFGPAAQVDTQTAGQSQWQRNILSGESLHFLEFVQAGIEDADRARDQLPTGEEEDETLQGSVDFETLLPPEDHSRVVAAQALLHVLSLGTKHLLTIEQDEAFGPLSMRVIAAQ